MIACGMTSRSAASTSLLLEHCIGLNPDVDSTFDTKARTCGSSSMTKAVGGG